MRWGKHCSHYRAWEGFPERRNDRRGRLWTISAGWRLKLVAQDGISHWRRRNWQAAAYLVLVGLAARVAFERRDL